MPLPLTPLVSKVVEIPVQPIIVGYRIAQEGYLHELLKGEGKIVGYADCILDVARRKSGGGVRTDKVKVTYKNGEIVRVNKEPFTPINKDVMLEALRTPLRKWLIYDWHHGSFGNKVMGILHDKLVSPGEKGAVPCVVFECHFSLDYKEGKPGRGASAYSHEKATIAVTQDDQIYEVCRKNDLELLPIAMNSQLTRDRNKAFTDYANAATGEIP